MTDRKASKQFLRRVERTLETHNPLSVGSDCLESEYTDFAFEAVRLSQEGLNYSEFEIRLKTYFQVSAGVKLSESCAKDVWATVSEGLRHLRGDNRR